MVTNRMAAGEDRKFWTWRTGACRSLRSHSIAFWVTVAVAEKGHLPTANALVTQTARLSTHTFMPELASALKNSQTLLRLAIGLLVQPLPHGSVMTPRVDGATSSMRRHVAVDWKPPGRVLAIVVESHAGPAAESLPRPATWAPAAVIESEALRSLSIAVRCVLCRSRSEEAASASAPAIAKTMTMMTRVPTR